jgi:hypothetical protein
MHAAKLLEDALDFAPALRLVKVLSNPREKVRRRNLEAPFDGEDAGKGVFV